MQKQDLESVDTQVFGQLWSLYQVKHLQETLDRVSSMKVKSVLKLSMIQFQLLLFLVQICLILIKILVSSEDIIFLLKVQSAVKQSANCLIYFSKYLVYKFCSKETVQETRRITSLFDQVNKQKSTSPVPLMQKQSVINSDTIRQLLGLLPYQSQVPRSMQERIRLYVRNTLLNEPTLDISTVNNQLMQLS